MSSLHPRFRAWLIQTYQGISLAMFRRLDPQTRGILVRDALAAYRCAMETEYGSLYAAFTAWCRRNGYRSVYDYQKYLAATLGYATHNEMKVAEVQRQGFPTRGAYYLAQLKKKGHAGWMDYLEAKAKAAGFASYAERRKAWRPTAKRRGVPPQNDTEAFPCATTPPS